MGKRLSKSKKKSSRSSTEVYRQTERQPSITQLHSLNTPPPVPTSTTPKREKANYVALFNYDKATDEDISLKKSDQLYVIKQENEDWWYVKNLRNNDSGYVPRTYIAPIGALTDLELKDWFHKDCSRREAERLLEYLDNEPGVFLIRESEGEKGKGWSLSILDESDDRKGRHIKHYRIRKTEDGACYITPKHILPTLDDLVAYYSKASNGLCRRLTVPCPKPERFVGFKDIWEESRENIELLEPIGSGFFGEVYKGVWRKKHIVAVKTVKFSNQTKNTNVDFSKEFEKELEIMKHLKHDKILKLWCVCTKEEPYYLVTEYMVNGCLLKYLRDDVGLNQKIGFKEIIDMASQIASGMKYLESINVVHRDLAARNILVGERNIVKIADFGFASKLDSNSKVLELSQDEGNKFPVKWTAPEVFTVDPVTAKRLYTTKSDVWSFGIVLYELITKGGVPYPGMNHPQVINEVSNKKYRMPKPANSLCTDTFYEIMKKCWHEDPVQRPTFETLYNIFNDYTISTERSYNDS